MTQPIPSRASITEARRLRALAVDSAARVVAESGGETNQNTARKIIGIADELFRYIQDGASEHKQPGQEKGSTS